MSNTFNTTSSKFIESYEFFTSDWTNIHEIDGIAVSDIAFSIQFRANPVHLSDGTYRWEGDVFFVIEILGEICTWDVDERDYKIRLTPRSTFYIDHFQTKNTAGGCPSKRTLQPILQSFIIEPSNDKFLSEYAPTPYAFNIVVEYLLKLRYNNYLGRLCKMENLDFSRLRQPGTNIRFGDDQCCVCYEQTCRQTMCNHYLCVKCASKIRDVCPLCRVQPLVMKKFSKRE